MSAALGGDDSVTEAGRGSCQRETRSPLAGNHVAVGGLSPRTRPGARPVEGPLGMWVPEPTGGCGLMALSVWSSVKGRW